MKKIISIVLIFAMLFSTTAILSGCDSSKNNVLTMYMIGDTPADNDLILEKANEIIEEEIGMKLDLEYIDSASYEQKMNLKMASGDEYDIAFTGYVNSYQTAVSKGGLYDITKLVKETGLDKVISKVYLDAATVDGSIYGIPNIQVVSNPLALSIRKSVAKECGIEEIMKEIEKLSGVNATYADMEKCMALYDEMFESVHSKRPDLYTWTPNIMLPFAPVYETLYGCVAIKRDGSQKKLVNPFTTDEWKLGVNKAREWYQKGYIRSDIASKGNSVLADEMKTVAFTGITWKPGQDAIDKKNYNDDYEYMLCHEPFIGRTSSLSTMLSVGANSKHPIVE